MEKLTLTRVARKEAQGAKGAYTRLSIKCKEYGDQWLSGFGRVDNASWKEGDIVEVTIDKVVKEGKEYLNFKMPEKREKVEQGFTNHKLDLLTTQILALTNQISTLSQKLDDFMNKPNEVPF